VVGNGNDIEAARRGASHDGFGRPRAVRSRAVDMEVEPH